VPGTKVAFDFSKLQLDITIPQTVLRDESSQGVPEEEWDDGIPALINNYQLSGQQYLKDRQGNASSVYANLTNGLNVGAWRYRNNSTLSNSEGWHSITNYVETAVHALKKRTVPGTKVAFDFSKLQLDITIPQTVLRDESSQGVP
uniref:FimD/PapC N-terminal domain-containing protein n=1 Tax=Cronobacter sakazakii TaxID=28141 RepID=UPI00387ACCB4